jgi:hypothetical protein
MQKEKISRLTPKLNKEGCFKLHVVNEKLNKYKIMCLACGEAIKCFRTKPFGLVYSHMKTNDHRENLELYLKEKLRNKTSNDKEKLHLKID